MDIGLSVTAMT